MPSSACIVLGVRFSSENFVGSSPVVGRRGAMTPGRSDDFSTSPSSPSSSSFSAPPPFSISLVSRKWSSTSSADPSGPSSSRSLDPIPEATEVVTTVALSTFCFFEDFALEVAASSLVRGSPRLRECSSFETSASAVFACFLFRLRDLSSSCAMFSIAEEFPNSNCPGNTGFGLPSSLNLRVSKKNWAEGPSANAKILQTPSHVNGRSHAHDVWVSGRSHVTASD